MMFVAARGGHGGREIPKLVRITPAIDRARREENLNADENGGRGAERQKHYCEKSTSICTGLLVASTAICRSPAAPFTITVCAPSVTRPLYGVSPAGWPSI